MQNRDIEDKALYNSRIVNNYIKLIKSKYSFINIEELLNYAGMEIFQVEDEAHWFSQKQINRFHKKLQETSGHSNIAREAGKHAASPDSIGMMRRYVLGLIGPQNAYELVAKYGSKFTKSSSFETIRLGPNKVEIKVTPNVGVKEEPYQCENRLGFWDAISAAFDFDLPEIEHPECVFKGGSSCRYIISWQKSQTVNLLKIRNVAGIALLLISLASPFFLSFDRTFTAIIPLSIALFACLSWYIGLYEIKILRNAINHLHETSDELINQVNLNYENSLMLNEIGQALGKENDLNGILSKVVNVLENRLDYDRGLILLANSNKTRLISKAGYGYELDDLSRFMTSSGFHLDRESSKGIFVNCFKKQTPYLINKIDEIEDDLSFRSLEFAKRMGVKSFICCPIVYEDEPMGVLAVDNLKTKKSLVQRDINVLMGIAPQIAVGIHNIRLVEARLKQFQSILQALVASTEARDPITAGHSLKVTDYSVGICRELGLPNEYTDMIRVASSLHDYGKIGVDDSILKKPARLNEEEYDHIKTHVDKTRSILEEIHFEGIFTQVPEIAASHHEKVDGTGYPDGLTDEEIPFGGKIIAVADVFEALTSRRHYRDPMPIDEALDYLVGNIGKHFDSGCVQAFINYYNEHESQISYIPKSAFVSLEETSN
ncbi:MAG: HD domain-containing protein [Cyclobacteriaceae bacterium]|nr:HD domain-containing protein [Cyclobacteriaceae bacterium]